MAIVVSNKTNISNFVQGNVRPVISISAATTLTTAESGSIVTVGKGAGRVYNYHARSNNSGS